MFRTPRSNSSFPSNQKSVNLEDQIRHYENKLAYEIDSWDLHVAMQAGEKLTVIDARSADAYAAGRIPGAVNIPHRTMTKETTSQIDSSGLVVTYCDGIGCNASTKAALNMTKLGFRVKELLGGLDWWKRDGHSVEGTEPEGPASGSCGCG